MLTVMLMALLACNGESDPKARDSGPTEPTDTTPTGTTPAGTTPSGTTPAGTTPTGTTSTGTTPTGTTPTGTTPTGTTPAAPLNVLVMLVDDLGLDKVGVYGAHPDPPPTPNIDALAAEGVRFTNAYSAPACSPTRAALLTGRYGRRTGIGEVVFLRRDPEGLSRDEITLPEMLQLADEPWSTLIVGKWHLAVTADPDFARDPLEQGFDHHAGSLDNLTVTVEDRPGVGYHLWEKTVDGVTAWEETYATTDSVDEALARIPEMAEPWLTYVAFNAIHTPFQLPPPELTPTTEDQPYVPPVIVAGMTEALDIEIGRLLDGLDPALRERTVILLVSDNGTTREAILPPWDENRSKLTLFDGGCRVPLIMAGPTVTAPGSTSDALVHVVDVFATVADLANVDLSTLRDPDGDPVPVDGRSLMPYLADPSAPSQRDLAYSERMGPNGGPPYRERDIRMVRDERYKLIRSRDGDQFFEYAPGAWSEGEDLLAGDGLDADQADAYARLSDGLEALQAELESGW
ncbi:MAG: arylsulfatase A-like enzyme [Myxococcota bacterium]|jgi:arylsulfatase A-like enzyme